MRTGVQGRQGIAVLDVWEWGERVILLLVGSKTKIDHDLARSVINCPCKVEWWKNEKRACAQWGEAHIRFEITEPSVAICNTMKSK